MQSDDKNEILEAVENMGRMMADVLATVATKDDVAELEAKIDGVEERLSGKLTNLQNRLDVHAGLDRRVESMDKRLTKVEEAVSIG